MAGSGEAVASPSPPAPPAKRKQRHQQQSEPTGGMEEMGEERLSAILQLDGDSGVSVCFELVAQPSSPASAPSPSAPPPPSPSSAAKKKCSDCNINDLFNYDFKKCRDCLKKRICRKCYSESEAGGRDLIRPQPYRKWCESRRPFRCNRECRKQLVWTEVPQHGLQLHELWKPGQA